MSVLFKIVYTHLIKQYRISVSGIFVLVTY